MSLTISTGLSSVRARFAVQNTALVGVIGALDVILSLVLISALFALIFRYMPARRLGWKSVAMGGLLTAVLFDLGRWAIGLYLAHSTQPSAFGAAASFAALLLWLYYTAQIFLFGAEFTACLGGLRDEDREGSGRPGQITRTFQEKLVRFSMWTVSGQASACSALSNIPLTFTIPNPRG